METYDTLTTKVLTLTGKDISNRDAAFISSIIYEALQDLGVDLESFTWSLEVSVNEYPQKGE